MELRHLRYFVAVAEEGSLTVAAQRRLFTAQPSLSRQMRDLEEEVGAQLLSRSVHGIACGRMSRLEIEMCRRRHSVARAAQRHAGRRETPQVQPAVPPFAEKFDPVFVFDRGNQRCLVPCRGI